MNVQTTTLLADGDAAAAMGMLAIIVLIAGMSMMLLIKRILYVCQPNEVLVFSGRSRTTGDSRVAGYRIIRGGRGWRVPMFETVDRMDLTNMVIEVTVRNAYSRGGIPLSVQGVANIKVPGEEPLLNNCLERFLGRPRQEIMKIARETLEGNLRGVLATLTPEQVNEDKEKFAEQLLKEAELDLNRLGLVLDTLKIQNVSDDVGYLDAIGRRISAQILMSAKVAEAQSQSEADVKKWNTTKASELAKLTADMAILERDQYKVLADLRSAREAMIAQQRAEVLALQAQAEAEVKMQEARIEQVRLQLAADILQPAEAERLAAEEAARGKAAAIVEKGRATAGVLSDLATTYRASGPAGRDIFLMQKLLPLLDAMSSTVGDLKIDRLTVLGQSGGAEGDSLASRLVRTTEEIKASTGVDVPQILQSRFAPKPGAG
jgi:flotillin